MMSIAIVTMVFNEEDFLPLWLKYYSTQTLPSMLYVIDHGSTDGSTNSLPGVNIVRIPRSPMDDKKRSRFLSEFCSSLLHWYEAVIYTDVDEYVVADPALYESLSDFSARCPNDVVTTIGFNIVHMIGAEPDLDVSRNIFSQRHFLRFSSAMCKPLFTRNPIKWVPGFHFSDQLTIFSNLYLFHGHYMDCRLAERKLGKTRVMDWAGSSGAHQRMSDIDQLNMMVSISKLPRIVNTDLTQECEFVQQRINELAALISSEAQPERFYLSINQFPDKLVELPERFRSKI